MEDDSRFDIGNCPCLQWSWERTSTGMMGQVPVLAWFAGFREPCSRECRYYWALLNFPSRVDKGTYRTMAICETFLV